MCGASLDATAKDDEAEKAKASRIKQKTMSQSKSEVAAALDQLRGESKVAAPAAEPPAASPAPAAAPLAADDPLGAYLEEVDEVGGAVESDDDFDDDWDIDAEPEPKQDANGSAAQSKTASAPAPAEEASRAPQPEKQKVFAESGKRTGAGGLSFSKPKDSKSEMPSARDDRRDSRSEWKQADKKASAPMPDSRFEDAPAYKEPVRAQAQPQRATQPAKTASPGTQGRLFGWLVSYKNADGSAIELREGKFFVTSNSLKPNDLLIDDSSVSTPHALMNISLEAGLNVQDLMSERGVHVRHADEDSFQREDSTQLSHGDWVRFGDAEFLVSIIAHVGQK